MGTFDKNHIKLLIEHSKDIIPEDVLKSIQDTLERNAKVVGDDIAKVKCVFCGTLYEVSDIQVDFYNEKDPHKIFEFHHKCQCGKHLTGERVDNYIRFDDRIIPSYREVSFKNCTNENTTNWQNAERIED
jgi:hypothetical protein